MCPAPPEEERLAGLHLPLDEIDGGLEVSSSTVSMRFLVSGPVSSIVCLPTLPKRGSIVGSSISVAQVCSTPRGPNFFAERGVLRIVLVLRLLLGIQMVEIAEELVEAVHRRQELVLVAEMVLAELPGGIALRP